MKLLISDYDGTIKTYEDNPSVIENFTFKENIRYINKFMRKNNKFVIATGRCTDFLYEEIEKYKIPFDYILSYNGRVIIDKNKNILSAEYIDSEFLKELDLVKIKDISFYDEFKLNNRIDNPIYIYLTLSDLEEVRKCLNEWNKKYLRMSFFYMYDTKRILIRKKYNKLLGIKKLLDIENIDIVKENIVTVGDDINDMEMINFYNGYKMKSANPDLYVQTNNETSSVHKLIKKIK